MHLRSRSARFWPRVLGSHLDPRDAQSNPPEAPLESGRDSSRDLLRVQIERVGAHVGKNWSRSLIQHAVRRRGKRHRRRDGFISGLQPCCESCAVQGGGTGTEADSMFAPTHDAKASSNSATLGPVVSQSERSTSTTLGCLLSNRWRPYGSRVFRTGVLPSMASPSRVMGCTGIAQF